MDRLVKLQRNWEGFARADPFWAICVDPQKRGNGWRADELLATGEREIEAVLGYLRSLNLSPNPAKPALDFGCGVGRLTRALAQRFTECWGIDISPTMIRLAQEMHRGEPRCKFWLNDTDELRRFPDGHFGFIYSSITLQHIPTNNATSYLREFARIVAPGGVVLFQVADSDKTRMVQRMRNFIGLRRKWRRILQPRNVESFHMAMHCVPERHVRATLSATPLRIVDVTLTNSTDRAFNGDLRFLQEEPSQGYVSKQYCAVRQVTA